MPIGAKVTLRGVRMYEFLDRLVSLALPELGILEVSVLLALTEEEIIRLEIKEQIIFPEIDIDKIKDINGMDITFVTTAPTNEEARALLTEFGLPFKK